MWEIHLLKVCWCCTRNAHFVCYQNNCTLEWLVKPVNNCVFFSKRDFFSCVVHYECKISVWNWSNAMNILSALWVLMVWCFNTRASVATLLNMHNVFPVVYRLKMVVCAAETYMIKDIISPSKTMECFYVVEVKSIIFKLLSSVYHFIKMPFYVLNDNDRDTFKLFVWNQKIKIWDVCCCWWQIVLFNHASLQWPGNVLVWQVPKYRCGCWYIKAELWINVSVNCISIGSGNRMLPVWHHAITWTNADLLSIRILWGKSQWNFDQNTFLFFSRKYIWKCFPQNDNGLLLGWGLLSQFSLFHYFLNFSEWSKHGSLAWYHIHIWQVS